MQNYEYILVDSSKRSSGSACDFSYELNRPVRDIKKLELVYSSLSNTILTFTDKDYFYFQEERNPYTPGATNKIYLEEPKLAITGYNFTYDEETTTIVSGDRVFKFFEMAEDGVNKLHYSFLIKEDEFNVSMFEFAMILHIKFNEIGSFDYTVEYVSSTDSFKIQTSTGGEFGLDFETDLDIHLKIGYEKKKYEPNNAFVSINATIENNPEVITRVERYVSIPTGSYSFNTFMDTLQQLLNNVYESSFSYRVELIYDLLSIKVIQDETNIIKKFRLPSNDNQKALGFTQVSYTPYNIQHIAAKVMKGTIYTLTLNNIPYSSDTLSLEIQNVLRLINDNYTVKILDETIMEIRNDDTKFKIINDIDSLPFIFTNVHDEFSHIQISESSTAFQGEGSLKNIQFENGSYTSDDILEYLKLQLNSDGRSGYDAQISLSNFKISISNETKKFKLLFSKSDSVFKKFGFEQKDTEYLNEHVSDYTASLESSDYILVQIRGVATPITNKNTSGSFFIPIISSRYEVQTVNENQSFNQAIYTGGLDLSDLNIKLLDDEGNILQSEELNLKMLIKCYK